MSDLNRSIVELDTAIYQTSIRGGNLVYITYETARNINSFIADILHSVEDLNRTVEELEEALDNFKGELR
jgi:hypothetical protein